MEHVSVHVPDLQRTSYYAGGAAKNISLWAPGLYPKYRVKFEGKLVPIIFSCRFLPY